MLKLISLYLFPIVLFLSLPLHVAASHVNDVIKCKTLLTQHKELSELKKLPFILPSQFYTHIIRLSDVSGWGTSLYDFTRLLYKLKATRTSFQKEWFPLSYAGSIWTYSRGANDFTDGGNYYEATIKVLDGYRFANAFDAQEDFLQWTKLAVNRQRKNKFSRSQVDQLRQQGFPSHSAYYRDRKIAGFSHWKTYGLENDPWSGVEITIVTADAIESVTFKPHIKKSLITDGDGVYPGVKLATKEYHLNP